MFLIGDNPNTTLDVYQSLFDVNGQEIHIEQDIETLFAKALKLEPELLLLNIEHIGDRIYRLCVQIREKFRLKNIDIPLIVINVDNLATDKDRCFRAGASDIITKP